MIRIADWVISISATITTVYQSSSVATDPFSVIEKYGPVVAVVAYFLVRDQAREKRDKSREDRMGRRINTLEDFQSGKLMEMLEKNVKALDDVAVAIKYCREQSQIKVRT